MNTMVWEIEGRHSVCAAGLRESLSRQGHLLGLQTSGDKEDGRVLSDLELVWDGVFLKASGATSKFCTPRLSFAGTLLLQCRFLS